MVKLIRFKSLSLMEDDADPTEAEQQLPGVFDALRDVEDATRGSDCVSFPRSGAKRLDGT